MSDSVCDCPKCKARRGESICDPPPAEPADQAATSVYLIHGVTDPTEQVVLGCVSNPLLAMLYTSIRFGGDRPTRAEVLAVVAQLAAHATPQAVERALDALLAAGLIAEEEGGLRMTNLGEFAAQVPARAGSEPDNTP